MYKGLCLLKNLSVIHVYLFDCFQLWFLYENDLRVSEFELNTFQEGEGLGRDKILDT